MPDPAEHQGGSAGPPFRFRSGPLILRSWLYKVLPGYPAEGSTWLLMGKAVNPEKPGFGDNPVAWTWKTPAGGKVFATTQGHPEDFRVAAFQRLTVNGIHWALNKPVPKKWKGKITIDVPCRGMCKEIIIEW